jgi:NADH-quinone oxidoreductase subunit J
MLGPLEIHRDGRTLSLPASRKVRALFAYLALTLTRTEWALSPDRPLGPTTNQIGQLFMGRFLLPFEAASILLLVALMGAAMIVRRKKDA